MIAKMMTAGIALLAAAAWVAPAAAQFTTTQGGFVWSQNGCGVSKRSGAPHARNCTGTSAAAPSASSALGNFLGSPAPAQPSQMATRTAPSPAPAPSTNPADQLWAAGSNAYRAGNMPQAAELFRQGADLGDARAAAALGEMYASGRGVPRDPAQALQLLTTAANAGNRGAQFNLAFLYESGNGVPADPAAALGLYQASARQSFPRAELRLGVAQEFGELGLDRDRQAAMGWLNRAAEHGDAQARQIIMVLRNPQAPQFQNMQELAGWQNQQSRQAAAQQLALLNGAMQGMGGLGGLGLGGGHGMYGGGIFSGFLGGGSSSGGGDPCGGYTDYAACNAHKVGEDWAADRLQRHESTGAERDWYQ